MLDIDELPKVALDFMNSDHEEATCITNRLMALVEAGDNDTQRIGDTLKLLHVHCTEHFARENVQMEHFKFPAYSIHRREHEQVLQEMQDELDAWGSSGNVQQLKLYVFKTLPEWFIGHIQTMDTVTAMFIQQHGGPFESPDN